MKAIDAELARHWSAATLAAVRQDDPLAFGIERLRAAPGTYAHDLADLEAALPPDRTHAVSRGQAEAGGRRTGPTPGSLRRRRGAPGLHVASQRHWGRRDKQALAGCLRALEKVDDDVAAALEAERDARRQLEAEKAAQRERAEAVEAVAPQRQELIQALAELDAALDDTRATRVAAMAAEPVAPPPWWRCRPGPGRPTPERQAWCGLAYRVESYRDRHPEALGHEASGGVAAAIGPRPADRWHRAPEWDHLAGELAHGVALVATAGELAKPREPVLESEASSWLELVNRAGQVLEAQTLASERGISRDHGMELGL